MLVATAGVGAPWAGGFDTEADLLGEAPLDDGRDLRPLGRKAAMLWLAPSAKMNFSRSSTFVLPFATEGERDGEVWLFPCLSFLVTGRANLTQIGQTNQTH